MTEPKAYDLVVVGTGTAAQVASSRVRAAAWSVAVIDHLQFGGTCALRGCDPKKILISGAEAVDLPRRMHSRGVVGDVKMNWRDLIAFKRTFTIRCPPTMSANTLRAALMRITGQRGSPDRP
jgi:glutathione reductase (NADPH)